MHPPLIRQRTRGLLNNSYVGRSEDADSGDLLQSAPSSSIRSPDFPVAAMVVVVWAFGFGVAVGNCQWADLLIQVVRYRFFDLIGGLHRKI